MIILTLIINVLLFFWLYHCYILLKEFFKKQNDKFLENIRSDSKVREQAACVAEYMAIARDLKDTDPQDAYRRANQLAWELAIWLPEDVYKAMGKALITPDSNINPLSVVIEVRKILLGKKAGSLTQNDVLHHGPGISKLQN